MLDHPFLQIALLAAKRGAVVLNRHFRSSNHVAFKASYNLVSEADLKAQQAIETAILTALPEHEILGEEDSDLIGGPSLNHIGGSEISLDWPKDLWIVDPLDGTNNFCHGLDHFAISIAYYHSGVPDLCVIYRPRSDDWFLAAAGQGSWHNGNRVHVSKHSRLDQCLIGVGFYYDRDQQMRWTLKAIESLFQQKIHGIRRMGTASLDLCMVGTGCFGGFFEFQLASWDYAAGKLFVQEAGGTVTNCLGNAFDFGNSSIIAATPDLHAAMLDVVQPCYQAANQTSSDCSPN